MCIMGIEVRKCVMGAVRLVVVVAGELTLSLKTEMTTNYLILVA